VKIIMLFPLRNNRTEELDKKAFDVTPWLEHSALPWAVHQAIGTAAGEATMKGANKLLFSRGGSLLNTGIQLGKDGKKMAPFTETIGRNVVGNKGFAPYDLGLRMGGKIKKWNLDPEEESRFISRIVESNVAKKEQMEAAGQKVKNPMLHAFDQYQTGSDRKQKLFHAVTNSKPTDQESKGLLGKAKAHALSIPGAIYGDFRLAARPALAKAEQIPKATEHINKLFPVETKRGKLFEKTREYID
jgi:hypothetical protein